MFGVEFGGVALGLLCDMTRPGTPDSRGSIEERQLVNIKTYLRIRCLK